MMIVAVLSLFLVSSFAAGPFNGPAYEALNRQVKQSKIWNNVTQTTTAASWYSAFQAAELLVESMDPSFLATDDMPNQYIGKLFERKKLIHTVGVIAKCSFVITNNRHNYTGLFSSGADSAFIRLSLANEPQKVQGPGCFAPGISIKFMRDKVSSGNIVSMFALNGQDNFNFFDHDFTNHVPSLGDWAPLPLKVVAAKFRRYSEWPTMVGVSNMALYDQLGNEVPTPRFPYRLIFHPNSKYHMGFPRNATGQPFYDVLSQGLQTGLIYEVYAQHEPLQGNSELFKIGEINLTTEAVPSVYADRHFFIQHTKMEEDFAYYPNWEAGAAKEVAAQDAAASPGYMYGDLPFNK